MKTIEQFRSDFDMAVKSIISPERTSPGKRGLIVGLLNKFLGDANRKQFLRALTGKSSSKDLTDAEWEALQWFLDPENEGEVISKIGELDIAEVLAAAMPPQNRLF